MGGAVGSGTSLFAEDEEGGGEDTGEDWAKGGEASGYYVVCWFVDCPDCPAEGGAWDRLMVLAVWHVE